MQAAKNSRSLLMLGCVCLLCSDGRADDRPTQQQLAFFEKRIRPVLIEHCYECHSENAKKIKGGLRLDLAETLRHGGETGPAVVPGQPEKSLLIESIRYESLEMPPKGKLPEPVIADFAKWVAMGAPDPRDGKSAPAKGTEPRGGQDHWAFQPVRQPARPDVVDTLWPLTGVDAFVLSQLEAEGLSPAKDADRYTWLRRVSFDVTGLPPTIDEIQDFQQDASPHAHEQVVDRLLSSRGFGECWARHWLDLVGYADQIGTSNNVFAQHAWRYRDYVVDGLNEDKPFDDFIREQIAGDLLPYDSVEERAAGIVATGFLVLGDLEIVEADKAKLHVDVIDQQLNKVSTAFLGMTIGCARCHDHKFDPISQRDYYAIAGFFHSTDSIYKTDRGVWSDVIAVELPENESQQAERQERQREHSEKVAAMKDEKSQATARKKKLDELIASQKSSAESSADGEQALATLTQERDRLAARIGQLAPAIVHAEFFAPGVPHTYGVRDVDEPTDMQITIRANPHVLGDRVPRGFLTVASTSSPVIPEARSGRKQLAEWMAAPDNPLSARVAVNRIWQRLFGAGLVRTVDYFGVRGERPSHPELLDHLAARFVQDGWSRKKLLRSLLLSRTYRMSTALNRQAQAIDPENRLLWRMNNRRLDAEALRDAMLAVSDQLQPSPGGPALPLEFPQNVSNIDPTNVNPPSFQLSKWRPQQPFQRTIYLPVIRSGPQPGPAELRNVFDFTQPAAFAGQRSITAVPTQALFLMNSSVVKEHAAKLAHRVEQEATESAQRLDRLWLRTLNRLITAEERHDANTFLESSGDDGWTELCHALLASNEFLMRL